MRFTAPILAGAAIILGLLPTTTQAATTTVRTVTIALPATDCGYPAGQPCEVHVSLVTRTLTQARAGATHCLQASATFPFTTVFGINDVTLTVSGIWCWNNSIVWPSGGVSCGHEIPPFTTYLTTWCGENAGWTSAMQFGQNGCWAFALPPYSAEAHDNFWGRIYFNNSGGASVGGGVGFHWGSC